MLQEEYNNIQSVVERVKSSKHLDNKTIEIIEKLEKLMDNEYNYGSSNNEYKKIMYYFETLKLIN